jgi:GNAT superfamily N-acetyltransferase
MEVQTRRGATSMGYSIRRAEKADLDQLTELLLALQDHLEASNPNLWRMKDAARSHLRAQLSARLTAPGSRVLVAEHTEDGVIAAILGRVVTNKRYRPARAGSVDQAFVRADHRRAGVGTLLMDHMCRFFADEGVDDLSLRYVVGNSEAGGFWAALGFSPRIITTGALRSVVEERLAETCKTRGCAP